MSLDDESTPTLYPDSNGLRVRGHCMRARLALSWQREDLQYIHMPGPFQIGHFQFRREQKRM